MDEGKRRAKLRKRLAETGSIAPPPKRPFLKPKPPEIEEVRKGGTGRMRKWLRELAARAKSGGVILQGISPLVSDTVQAVRVGSAVEAELKKVAEEMRDRVMNQSPHRTPTLPGGPNLDLETQKRFVVRNGLAKEIATTTPWTYQEADHLLRAIRTVVARSNEEPDWKMLEDDVRALVRGFAAVGTSAQDAANAMRSLGKGLADASQAALKELVEGPEEPLDGLDPETELDLETIEEVT